MNRVLRNATRVAVVSLLTVGTLPVGGSVHADGIRTETGLAGFYVGVEASPLLVLVDDPNAAVPRPTGTAVVEGDPNFTLASVAAGPNARAVASTLWPGNLFGEGLAQVTQKDTPYPLKAESRYPDQPYTQSGADGGVLTNSSAIGLDAVATADGAPTNKPGEVRVGHATSTSIATVTDKDLAKGSAVSAVHDISLVSDLITIDDVTTRLTVGTDGKTASSTGSTTVTGFKLGPVPCKVDDKGLSCGGEGTPLQDVVTPDQLKEIGITVGAVTQVSSKTSSSAKRTASGLTVRIDSTALKAQLAPGIDQLRGPFADVISQIIPPAQQGYFYYLLNATPSLTFIFGAASANTAATLPITFSFPPPAFPPATGGLTGPVPSGGTLAPPPAELPGLTGEPPSAVSPPPPGPVLVGPGSSNLASVKGVHSPSVGGLLVLGALAASGLVGWLLTRLLGLAGGALGLGCRLGAPTSVPNLRSVTA